MNVRKIAYRVLRKLEKDGRFPTEESKMALSRMEKRERAFFKELVWGTMRKQIYIDWLLNEYLKNPEIPPAIRIALRMGVYQILFMDSVPNYAAVAESVKLVENVRFRKLVNAILRRISREGFKEPDEIHIKYSHPEWIYKELLKWGNDVANIVMEDHSKPLPTVLRVNTLKTSREELLKRLQKEGIDSRPTKHSPFGIIIRYNGDLSELPAIREGLAIVQGESSQIVTAILDPKPGSKILDMASGMGGKTTHMAEYTKDDAEILAVDDFSEKIDVLMENAKRLGINSIKTLVADSRRLSSVIKEKFDYILLDAPCTSLGTARKNPDVLLTTRPDDPEKMRKVQKDLLDQATRLLKEKGKLAYSICTFTKAESTDLLREFLERNGDMRVVDIRENLGNLGVDYVWDGLGAFMIPDGDVLTEFYIAAFEKK